MTILRTMVEQWLYGVYTWNSSPPLFGDLNTTASGMLQTDALKPKPGEAARPRSTPTFAICDEITVVRWNGMKWWRRVFWRMYDHAITICTLFTQPIKSTIVLNPRRCIMGVYTREIRMRVHKMADYTHGRTTEGVLDLGNGAVSEKTPHIF